MWHKTPSFSVCIILLKCMIQFSVVCFHLSFGHKTEPTICVCEHVAFKLLERVCFAKCATHCTYLVVCCVFNIVFIEFHSTSISCFDGIRDCLTQNSYTTFRK